MTTPTSPTAAPSDVEWRTHPEAADLVDGIVAEALTASPRLRGFAERLAVRTSTRLVDWVDHLRAPVDAVELAEAGFVEHPGRDPYWRHPGAQLPAVAIAADRTVAVRCDDAAAFAAMHGENEPMDGTPLSGLRLVEVCCDVDQDADPVRLLGAERRSWASGLAPTGEPSGHLARAVRARDEWTTRPRCLGSDEEDLAAALEVAREMVGLVGSNLAASIAMQVEREYWQRRCFAGALQFARQDQLGLGWGNQDHHTFRSSRHAFGGLMAVLDALGFVRRERFYAGDEAGWGAQVLEHPGAGVVIFADVDLTPEEVAVDFAHADLPDTGTLGTVGLWCALHGESILAAGMHHLEGQFDFDRLRDDLAGHGVAFMAPFSDLPHLRQAFTEAEWWPVAEARIAALEASSRIDAEQAARFRHDGAAGSHLENLARRGGFKGFNQSNVSATMRRTDPRTYRAPTAVDAPD